MEHGYAQTEVMLFKTMPESVVSCIVSDFAQ
jgi:hypothetical protein